ncbi:MAG: peptidase domain-containing ABC transporter [Magnetococcales bacterium]|nr:peptidase domain-containing ABC transporter [Magnetococcales bacterium]
MHSAFKSLLLVSRQHGIELNLDSLQNEYSVGDTEAGDNILVKAARKNGLKAKKVRFRWKNLAKMGDAFPAIARLNNGRCVVITGFQPASKEKNTPERVMIIDPIAASPKVERVTEEKFTTLWDGQMVLIRRDYGLTDDEQPFSAAWLIGGFLKQKALMISLVFIAFILHAFAVLPVVFIIIILDKVVSYQAESTLYVVTIGVIIAFIFNAFLGYLRQYIIIFTTSRVDVRLNSKVFQKLLNLPMSYFQKLDTSTITKTVQQTNSIRNILAQKFFAAILDSTALLIFIPILYFYNPLLCMIVIVFSALIAVNVIVTARIQKNALGQAVQADNCKQSILNNSINGIETIKGLAVEPFQNREWEEAVYRHTEANFQIGKITAASGQISGLLQQLLTVVLIFIGVQLVFSGELSAGVLIGVNMLGGRVTTPLVQLITLRMDIDKLKNAISSLEGVINTRGEINRKGGSASEIIGGVSFKSVSYSYPDGTQALNNVSLTIRPRTRVAIIGTSGSGKSTLVKLMQKLMPPASGTISLDNQDIRIIDPGKLRSRVALVNEDTILFGGSIRDNIRMPFPNASMQRIVWAAKLVGLHDEVEHLPDGYETSLVDGGTNLTSGQRLKIAMARALIRNPNVLILDGVFSHFEVEGILELREHLKDVASGRTLMVISKQLAPVSDFELILVMDQGKLVEWGSHKTLLERNKVYGSLWHKEVAILGVAKQGSSKAANKVQPSSPQGRPVSQPVGKSSSPEGQKKP